MSWKHYQNEIILALVAVFAVSSFAYKSKMHHAIALENQRMAQEIAVMQETASLKKIWGDKRISSKLDAVRKTVPSSKLTWNKRGKKLTAVFSDLQPKEVNRVVSKLLNIPIQIERLSVEKKGETYNVEIRCKW